MNDCSNADIRDQLPDLLHERLSASDRAAVLAHVDGCADCRDELELLRGVRGALKARTPRVDVAFIVGALPRVPARTAVPATAAPRKVRWADWRVAAAVTMLVAGGSSVAILNRAPVEPETRASVPSVPVTDSPAPRVVATPPSTGVTPIVKAPSVNARETIASSDDQDATTDAGPDGRFGGLTEAQLKTLLDEIDRLEAVPVTEPEPVTIKVNVGSPTALSEIRP